MTKRRPPNHAEIESARKYWRNELVSTPVAGDFRPSRKGDVLDAASHLTKENARRYEKAGVQSILRGEGVFSVLVAGASARMNTAEAPAKVRKMLQHRLVRSKAAVPIGEWRGEPVTYLDEFGQNLGRLLDEIIRAAAASGIESHIHKNDFLLFSNPAYLAEHRKLLSRANRYGLSNAQIRFFLQPLGTKFWATPEDAARLAGKVSADRHRKMLAFSKRIAERIAKDPAIAIVPNEREPLGHGEYFHQLIVSGEILRWFRTGKKWVFVKNVDNCAAKLDRLWLRILGYFLDQRLDFQVEVSPRSTGQKGGALIVMKKTLAHQIAEDPNILATNRQRGFVMDPSDSYWINDAVALFTPRYVLSLYKDNGASDREFLSQLERADRTKREAIAERGRRRFPSILDVKPAKRSAGATVKRETNLWQSTGLVPDEIRIRAIGVRGVRNLSLGQYFHQSFEEKTSELAKLRFLSTKQWDLPKTTAEAARKSLSRDLGRSLSRAETLMFMETYEGNQSLFRDLMRYSREVELVTPGILRSK